MSRGIIYCMTTVVPGLIKIGRTGSDKFESRMYNLEHNGYCNVVGLQRQFAIEVEDYEAKENMLNTIFSKSNVPNTELFALDIDIVVQLLSSFEGNIIYPKNENKKEIFEDSLISHKIESDNYYYARKIKADNRIVSGVMRIVDGKYILQKGAVISFVESDYCGQKNIRKKYESKYLPDGILKCDIVFDTPSGVADFISGSANNGWLVWKNSEDEVLDKLRNK